MAKCIFVSFPVLSQKMTDETSNAASPANENEINADAILGADGKPLSKKQLKKLEQQKEKEAKKAETQARLASYFICIRERIFH